MLASFSCCSYVDSLRLCYIGRVYTHAHIGIELLLLLLRVHPTWKEGK